MTDLHIESWAVVVATLLGPILAVRIQRHIDLQREQRARKQQVFRVLMVLRLSLTPEAVQSLNAVPIEFYGVDAVMVAWRAYLKHLEVDSDRSPEHWGGQRIDLFIKLLQEMAAHLSYTIDFVALKNDFYSPKYHANVEADQETIRRGLADLLSDRRALPMKLAEIAPEGVENGKLLNTWLKKQLRDSDR